MEKYLADLETAEMEEKNKLKTEEVPVEQD